MITNISWVNVATFAQFWQWVGVSDEEIEEQSIFWIASACNQVAWWVCDDDHCIERALFSLRFNCWSGCWSSSGSGSGSGSHNTQSGKKETNPQWWKADLIFLVVNVNC